MTESQKIIFSYIGPELCCRNRPFRNNTPFIELTYKNIHRIGLHLWRHNVEINLMDIVLCPDQALRLFTSKELNGSFFRNSNRFLIAILCVLIWILLPALMGKFCFATVVSVAE